MIPPGIERADADAWRTSQTRQALVEIIARDIPDDCDLADQGDVLRALMALGYSPRHVDDVLDDAIDAKRIGRFVRRCA